MTTPMRPIFKKLLSSVVDSLKKGFVHSKAKIQGLWQPSIKKLSLSPLEHASRRPNTKWVLAETTDINNKNKQLVLVEVEQFTDYEHSCTAQSFPYSIPNYTIEGEDPNLRITHYPSNRLH